MELTTTNRGFALIEFLDRNQAPCSIQKSSLAFEDAVWIGVDDPSPKILHGEATRMGVPHEATCGWVPYPIPEEVMITSRMHLTREQVAELIPVLQRFVETGDLSEREEV